MINIMTYENFKKPNAVVFDREGVMYPAEIDYQDNNQYIMIEINDINNRNVAHLDLVQDEKEPYYRIISSKVNHKLIKRKGIYTELLKLAASLTTKIKLKRGSEYYKGIKSAADERSGEAEYVWTSLYKNKDILGIDIIEKHPDHLPSDFPDKDYYLNG